ncbi:MAG: flavodoxin domain-containing protein [Proteobacteria bacterium]|nr:flavodoxin domain-containing protein [Pseudomonadota bacterium]MBU1451787.1 flavodoxin domain-containing protein [Pseudomonadota bacterium]
MKPVEIKDNIYWVGAVDWNIRDFHGYSTYKGTTYNAYLAKDEKVALFDTVKKPFYSDLLHRLHNIMNPSEIDYLVVNHMEMDHSGSLKKVVETIKPEKIYTSVMGAKSMAAHYKVDNWPIEAVKTGDSLSLGRRSVHFLETRMIHWPDSMFSYIPEEKLLISSDGFGQHWATSERFDDEVDNGELMRQAAKYYANILLLFSPMIQKLLEKVGEMGLEIDMIAPDHGLIWRKNPGQIIQAYQTWSQQKTTAKALVIYDTMWHSTETMAKAIYDGISDTGVSVQLMNLACTHRSDVLTEVLDAKALVFGSPTLNNGMLPRMADLLHYLRGLKPADKICATFGSYGWSGEAPKLMAAQLEDMKLSLIEEPLRLQWVPDHESLKPCRELGTKIGQAVADAHLPASCRAIYCGD